MKQDERRALFDPEIFLRTLYELWCDQHGIEAEIIIERKETP
jgi:hypothetical protein